MASTRSVRSRRSGGGSLGSSSDVPDLVAVRTALKSLIENLNLRVLLRVLLLRILLRILLRAYLLLSPYLCPRIISHIPHIPHIILPALFRPVLFGKF